MFLCMQIITCSRSLLNLSLRDALEADAGTFEQVHSFQECDKTLPSQHEMRALYGLSVPYSCLSALKARKLTLTTPMLYI